ncbi:MAG: nitroreductase, partial [Comamonas sp.]
VVVCGVALGWADPLAPDNQTQTEREPLAQYFQVLS